MRAIIVWNSNSEREPPDATELHGYASNACARLVLLFQLRDVVAMSPSRKRVLCIEGDESTVNSRRRLLASSGFEVLVAPTASVVSAITRSKPVDAVVVNASVLENGAAAVCAQLRQKNPRIPILVLTAQAAAPEGVSGLVDACITEKDDSAALLSRLESLIRLRNHSHPELEKEYVVFADSSRRYVDCSDGVCRLLGYSRMELLNMTIDDVSFHAEKTSVLFDRYVKGGSLEGQYILKHRSGNPIFIRYEAHVFSDGCLAAIWEPVEDWKQVYQSALLEFDLEKLKDEVDIADVAIQLRQRELTAQGNRDPVAWQELEDALSGLKVLRRDLV
jgi:DNA-binding response OmpR family regulator